MWHDIFGRFAADFSYIENSKVIVLIFLILVLVYIHYFYGKKSDERLPPGPVGLPVFGYYPFLGKEPEKTLNELGKKYGNVFGFYIGSKYIVILNDWDTLKEGLGQNSSLFRPPKLFAEVPYKLGIAGVNGQEWMETRRLASKVMKDIGLHSAHLEELVQEEVHEIVHQIMKHEEQPVDAREFFCESFANTMVTLVLGERLKHGNSITKGVTTAVDAIVEYTPTVGLANFSPILSKILQLMGFEKKQALAEKVEEFGQFVSNTVDERIKKLEIRPEDSFISRYYTEIESGKKDESSHITVDSLKGAVLALLTGGSETSRTSIIWALMAMADHPDKQQKVHEELDRVIGKDGVIHWADRFKIPYTYATLMESMRYSTVVPLSTMRMAAEDMKVQGYLIPKGTYITANFWVIHNDPKYWNKPDQFIPERFFFDDGERINTAPESFCPFSYGKRICPGKLIAFMEILQYFTILMQNFKVLPKEGDKVQNGTLFGLTYQATNVELRFIRRQQKFSVSLLNNLKSVLYLNK